LVEMIRKIQPGIIIDNRLTQHGDHDDPKPYSGDFASPEQIIPRRESGSKRGADPLGGLYNHEQQLGLCSGRQGL